MSDAVRIEEGQVNVTNNFTSSPVDAGRFSYKLDVPKSDYPMSGARVIEFHLKSEFSDAEIQAAFAAFAEEDRELANAGIGEYCSLLDFEDRQT